MSFADTVYFVLMALLELAVLGLSNERRGATAFSLLLMLVLAALNYGAWLGLIPR